MPPGEGNQKETAGGPVTWLVPGGGQTASLASLKPFEASEALGIPPGDGRAVVGASEGEGLPFPLGLGRAADRSWHFRIGFWPPLLQDPPLGTAQEAAGYPGALCWHGGYSRVSFFLSVPFSILPTTPYPPLGPRVTGKGGKTAPAKSVWSAGAPGPGSWDCRRKAWEGACQPEPRKP